MVSRGFGVYLYAYKRILLHTTDILMLLLRIKCTWIRPGSSQEGPQKDPVAGKKERNKRLKGHLTPLGKSHVLVFESRECLVD